MNIIKTTISMLLTMLVICMLYGLFVISNISSFFTVDNIKKTASDIDVTHEIQKIQNSSSVAGGKADLNEVINRAYAEAERHGISNDLVDEIFNSKEVKSFLGTAIGNTTDYVINGKNNKPVTNEDFNRLIDDNIDKWLEKSNTELSDTKKEVLVVRLKEASAGIINNIPNQEIIDSRVDKQTLKDINFLFSKEVKTTLVVLIMLSLTVILLLKRKENKWLVYTAMAILIAGLMTIATSFLITDILDFALKEYNLSFMMSSFSDGFSHDILVTGIISSIIALLILLLYFVIEKRKISAQ